MKIKPGSLIEIKDTTSGIYIVENNEIISTKNLHIESGYYIVLDTIGDKKNIYIEILFKSLVVLIFHTSKVCSIIE
tara:strand:- start:162 stop:389 length:228 start_codon:yes stop_codon:yes gene_type:complete